MTSKSTRQQRQRVLEAIGLDWQGAVGISRQVKLTPLVVALTLGDPNRPPHAQTHTLVGRGDVEGRWNSTRGTRGTDRVRGALDALRVVGLTEWAGRDGKNIFWRPTSYGDRISYVNLITRCRELGKK